MRLHVHVPAAIPCSIVIAIKKNYVVICGVYEVEDKEIVVHALAPPVCFYRLSVSPVIFPRSTVSVHTQAICLFCFNK